MYLANGITTPNPRVDHFTIPMEAAPTPFDSFLCLNRHIHPTP